MTDREFMLLAIGEARLALAEGEVPVGAVLARDGEVIAAAHNLVEQRRDPTAHAEVLCLRKAAELLPDWRMDSCTLYVTLEPCPMCAGALMMSRMGRIVWGAPDPGKGCCGSVYDIPGDRVLGRTVPWQGGMMETECRALLDDFFGGRRRENRQ